VARVRADRLRAAVLRLLIRIPNAIDNAPATTTDLLIMISSRINLAPAKHSGVPFRGYKGEAFGNRCVRAWRARTPPPNGAAVP